MTETDPVTPPQSSPASKPEGRFHTYSGTSIPWYVRLAWVIFWVLAISYVFKYLLPALQQELTSPP